MAQIRSPQWNEETGVCEKHGIMQIPCPKCLAEHDPDVEVHITEMDLVTLDFDRSLSVRDFLPAEDGDWLMDRIIA